MRFIRPQEIRNDESQNNLNKETGLLPVAIEPKNSGLGFRFCEN